MEKLSKKEQQLIANAFEMTYGYAACELVSRSKIIAEVFRKCGIKTGSEKDGR